MKTINNNISIKIILILIFFISCSSEEEVEEVILLDPVITNQVVNLAAPQTGGMGQPIGGEFSKFDFKTGMKTASETDWDIAFRGTTIAVNGGAVTGTADEPVRRCQSAVSPVPRPCNSTVGGSDSWSSSIDAATARRASADSAHDYEAPRRPWRPWARTRTRTWRTQQYPQLWSLRTSKR